MKKMLALMLALMMVFALVGCTAEPDDETTEADTTVQNTTAAQQASKRVDIPFEDGQLYAAAFLGHQKMNDLEKYSKYLDSTDLPIQKISEGDFYLIIPRYDDMKVEVYQKDVNTEKETLVYMSEKGEPFILQCNISDIIYDAVVKLSNEKGETSFTPFISLKDGSVQIGEKGLNLDIK